MKLVYDFLEKLCIKKDDNIIVAVSYGPDSMMLLDIIKKFYKDNTIICAHVHHNHRRESDSEALELEKYCSKNNIIFEMHKIEEYTNNKFTEVEAREIRYKFFESLLDKYNTKYLFTAHHGDDLVETILMRLVRGSSLAGYNPISLISNYKEYIKIRPLLYATKEDILCYCKEKNIPFAVDKSNESLEYTRNRYRHNILPYLKEENKDVHLKFLSFSNTIGEAEEYLVKITENVFNKVCINNCINIKKILKEDNIIIKRVLELFLLENYKDSITLITKKHIDNILNMINSIESNSKLSMPNNMKLIKSYDKLYFSKEVLEDDYCYLYEDYLELQNLFIFKTIEKLEGTNNYYCALNSEELKLPLYFRNRLDSDKMEVLNLNGTKKIKDILINEKIDISLRKNYPVLCDSDGNILWLPGIKKSKYDKSKAGKYDIIIKCIKKED